MIEAYPLYWPENWPRTHPNSRRRAAFKTSPGKAIRGVVREVRLLCGDGPILSTNIPTRQDGLPYARAREPDDPGVAVYFDRGGQQQCIPCDKWDRTKDNLRAVELTIGALRGLDRWGAKEMVDAAFKGFAALPPPGAHWTDVLELPMDATSEEKRVAYKKKAKTLHPDGGGSAEKFQALQAAYESAKQ